MGDAISVGAPAINESNLYVEFRSRPEIAAFRLEPAEYNSVFLSLRVKIAWKH
jgi:hypothetical protein